MNPYQIIGLVLLCSTVFCLVVSVLSMLGVPLYLACLGVYLSGVWFMLGMQRRAQESSMETQRDQSRAMHYDRAIMQSKSVVHRSTSAAVMRDSDVAVRYTG